MYDLDLGVASGDGDGGEAVVTIVATRDEGGTVVDMPGGVVAEVEDEEFGDG